MTIDTSREAINRMTGMWGVGVKPNMARVTEVLTALASERDEALAREAALREVLDRWYRTGCPDCRGDCGSANPPVTLCLVRETDAALTSTATAAAARDAALVSEAGGRGLRRRHGWPRS